MIIGPNLRFGPGSGTTGNNGTKTFTCPTSSSAEAGFLYSIAILGMAANTVVMLLILTRPALRRWSQGLIFHQATVDWTRAALLVPLALSHHYCRPVEQCSIYETVFLLLATVSAVNLLTTVLNDTPLMPDDDGVDFEWLVSSTESAHWQLVHHQQRNKESGGCDAAAAAMAAAATEELTDTWDDMLGGGGRGRGGEQVGARLLDAPHCVLFGIVMIWFAAITVNLGPTFITGALANHVDATPSQPSCPLIQTPHRHYIVNLLWVLVNSLCLILTVTHLYRLRRDLIRSQRNYQQQHQQRTIGMGRCGEDFVGGNVTRLLHRLEHEGLQRIRMFTTVCLVYVVFWGPLFLTVVFGGQSGQHQSEGRGLASVGPPKDPLSHQVTLYICFAHAFVNPSVLLALHSGLRHQVAGMGSLLCCYCCLPMTASPSPQDDSSPDRLAGFGPRVQLPPIPTDYDIDYGRIINYNGVPSFLSPLPDRNHQQHVPSSSRPMETVI